MRMNKSDVYSENMEHSANQLGVSLKLASFLGIYIIKKVIKTYISDAEKYFSNLVYGFL